MLTCTFEDGHQSTLRHITLVALVLKDDKILLAKRAPHLSEGGKWCLPGGYMDRDETTVQGVTREVLEETGYQIEMQSLLRVIDTPNRPHEDRQNVELCFIAHAKEQVQQPDSETAELHWFALDQLPPAEELAFDHGESIELYLATNQPVSLENIFKSA